MKTSSITSSKYFIPATLFLLCFLLYGNTLHNDYAEDDILYTQNEFIIKGFSAFKDIWDKGFLYGLSDRTAYIQQYRPLTMLNFMTEVSIFGLNPHVSHFFNVLFFAFTVVLLYFFLQKILNEAEHSMLHHKQEIVIAATLLFLFHPIHTEVVANIKSRDEILGLLFGLLSFYFILLFREKNRNGYYFLSLTAFFAALFCKESALTFVAVIPLLLYFFTPEGKQAASFRVEFKKIVLNTIPFIVLVGIYLFIRSQVLQSMTFTHQIPISDNALMSTNNTADRLATSFVLLGKYIYMTFIPYPLSWDYSYNQIPIVSWGNIKPILSLLVCAGLLGFALLSIKRKSIYSFLILFFFLTLSLSCNLFFKIAGTFAERFLYVPSIAFCIALPILTAKALKSFTIPIAIGNNSQFTIIMGCLLIIYTIIVIPRNAEWKNDFTLYSSGVITSPNSEKTNGMLATIYMDSAQISKYKVKSAQYFALAANEFNKTIKIESYICQDTDSYIKLGVCFFMLGNYDSAKTAFKIVLEMDPKNSRVLNKLGLIYFYKKQYDSAEKYFIYANNTDSNNFLPLLNIELCYQNEGNFILALHYDSILLKKAPNYMPVVLHNMSIAHNNMGLQFINNNELDKALEEFTIALSIDSNLVIALKNMSLVYEKKGNKEMAKKYSEKANEKEQGMRLAPNP